MLQNLGMTIFLVDDDTLCLHLYKQFLKQLGYSNIEMFDNGNDCLQGLKEKHPAVVFLDYNMEDINGIEVLKKIKQFDPKIIVFLISGQEDIQVAVNAMKQGAVDYIIKSSLNTVRMQELMERVESLQAIAGNVIQKSSIFRRIFS